MDILVRRMANNSDMNVQATGIATPHSARIFSTVVLSDFGFAAPGIAMFPRTELPSVAAAIQDGIDRRLHTGLQIYISLDSVSVVDSAIGEAAADRTMTASTLMPWRSAGKPLTAFLVMQLIELQRLKLRVNWKLAPPRIILKAVGSCWVKFCDALNPKAQSLVSLKSSKVGCCIR